MKRASYISVLAIANLLLGVITGSMVASGQGKNSNKQGGELFTGGSKGTANRNAQWSADPDRGWVHSDESHSTHHRHNSSTAPKQAGGKNKESGKGRKRF